jgi:hypothetical protein
VKTAKHHIKKGLTVILLLAYLFSVSAYVVFHPKHPDGFRVFASAASSHLQQNSSSANNYNLQHGAFKSVIENKLRTKSLSVQTATFLFILVFSSFTLFNRIKKACVSFNPVPYVHPHNYLSLRTIRI